MRQRVVIVAAAVLASSSIASAATLGGMNASGLAAGSASVSSCDSDFTISYVVESGSVTSVTVDGIADPACEGADLSLTLVDVAGAALADGGPEPVPTDGDTSDNSVSVSVSPQPAAEEVSEIRILLVGP